MRGSTRGGPRSGRDAEIRLRNGWRQQALCVLRRVRSSFVVSFIPPLWWVYFVRSLHYRRRFWAGIGLRRPPAQPRAPRKTSPNRSRIPGKFVPMYKCSSVHFRLFHLYWEGSSTPIKEPGAASPARAVAHKEALMSSWNFSTPRPSVQEETGDAGAYRAKMRRVRQLIETLAAGARPARPCLHASRRPTPRLAVIRRIGM